MAGQYRFKDSNGNIVAQISASVEGAIAFSGSVVDFSQANNVILGNVQLAGTASNALLLDGFDSQAFAFTSSIHPFTASIAGTNTFTASIAETNTFTSSTSVRLNSIETITSSNVSRLNSIETITASNVARLNILEIKTGSLATTGSNTFIGTQTITGSLFISADLVVQGSSSLQNITASAVSIGTNIVSLNTANPAIRYAGLSIGDSGSVGGSGSFLYDSVQDEMIFVHRGTSTVVTSSVTLMGPQTYDNLGTETYPTSNYIQKGTGNEHLVDSCIIDNGTTVCVNATLKASGQVCSLMGNFGCIGINTVSPAVALHVDASGGGIIRATRLGTGAGYIQLEADGTNGTLTSSNGLLINTGGSQRVNVTSTGIACFSCQVCSAGLTTTNSIVLLKNAASDNRYIQFCDTNTGGYRYDFILQGTANGCGFGLYNNTTAAWSSYVTPNGNTGLGGTTSPAGRLEVWQCTNNRLVIDCANVQNEPRISSLDSSGNPQYLTINSYDLKIRSNGSEALRITDKKHLLVGTQTDLSFYSAWDSGVTRIGTSGVLFSYLNNVDNFIISQNYYVNAAGSDVRIASGAASNIYFATGDILFRTVGTAGAECATSWNTPLRLTCTGASLISGCSTFYCTAEFSKMQKSTNGNWYKIPFMVEKGSATGSARTVCIVDINNLSQFHEFIVHIDYGARLQGVSDSVTNISSRMYGINRFNDGAVAITDSSIPIGSAGNINTHAPVTAAVAASNRLVIKVDFSATPSYSSFVWGEIRVFSMENLNSHLSIPGNQW
jgi:hypothetical protein